MRKAYRTIRVQLDIIQRRLYNMLWLGGTSICQHMRSSTAACSWRRPAGSLSKRQASATMQADGLFLFLTQMYTAMARGYLRQHKAVLFLYSYGHINLPVKKYFLRQYAVLFAPLSEIFLMGVSAHL